MSGPCACTTSRQDLIASELNYVLLSGSIQYRCCYIRCRQYRLSSKQNLHEDVGLPGICNAFLPVYCVQLHLSSCCSIYQHIIGGLTCIALFCRHRFGQTYVLILCDGKIMIFFHLSRNAPGISQCNYFATSMSR